MESFLFFTYWWSQTLDVSTLMLFGLDKVLVLVVAVLTATQPGTILNGSYALASIQDGTISGPWSLCSRAASHHASVPCRATAQLSLFLGSF